jgi:hypothetical protein
MACACAGPRQLHCRYEGLAKDWTNHIRAVVGWFLGHTHKGRKFAHNVHSSFAPFVAFLFIGQVVVGIYLRLHLERGINRYIRRVAVICHGIIGKMSPIVSWVQIAFGAITLLGFCRADHLGQVSLLHQIVLTAVSCSRHHGKQFHCLWGNFGHHVVIGPTMATETQQKSGIL